MKKNEIINSVRHIPLGRLVNTHGLRGELRLLPYSFPCPTIRSGLAVFLQRKTDAACRYNVEAVRPHAPFLLLKLQGVDAHEQARALCDSLVLVEETSLLPLQEGEFYHHQVRGLKVFTTAGAAIGTITEVFFSGEHDVWVVRQEQKEYLIPVIEDIVRSIDISGGQAIIEPIPGLLE